jgi:hypothetical protein
MIRWLQFRVDPPYSIHVRDSTSPGTAPYWTWPRLLLGVIAIDAMCRLVGTVGGAYRPQQRLGHADAPSRRIWQNSTGRAHARVAFLHRATEHWKTGSPYDCESQPCVSSRNELTGARIRPG